MHSCWGGGKLSRPVYLDPTYLGIEVKLFLLSNSTYFNLSDREDVSIINKIQGKFNCFLCKIVPYT